MIMAAVGSLKPGTGVSYYTQSAGHRAGGTNYYTGAAEGQEPPGRWAGAQAQAMGLAGDVDATVMEKLYSDGIAPDGSVFAVKAPGRRTVAERVKERLAAEPFALPERVREITREAARVAREPNGFVDYTFNLSKDQSVAHTAAAWSEQQARVRGDEDGAQYWNRVRVRLEEIFADGNRVAMEHLERTACYGRTGSNAKKGNSSVRYVPGTGFVYGTFFQHTSRSNDPQLHFHNPILNATVKPDGKVGALDTKLLYQEKAAATALGARHVQERITAELGWTWHKRTDGNGHELDNIAADTMKLFSERSKNVTQGVQAQIDDYVERFGYEPPTILVTRMRQAETLRTRPSKPGNDGPTRDEDLARFDAQMKASIGESMARVAARMPVQTPPAADDFSPGAVVKQAIARCQEVKSAFTRSDLIRAIEAELPSNLGCGTEGAFNLIHGLADIAIEECVQITGTVDHRVPADFQHPDGTSAYMRPGSTAYASQEHLTAERALERAAVVRGRAAVTMAQARTWLEEHPTVMSADQENAVVGIMTSGAKLSALQGPAGCGKTLVMGHLSTAWSDLTGGRVYGLSASEQATEVLRGEGVQAKNSAQWLAAQRRIAAGRPNGTDHEWAIQPDDIIVLDEASMSDTARATEILGYTDRAGARAVMAGDTRQLAAVGAAGAMDLVVNAEGADKYELTHVRRFKAAWEGKASLDLRDGVPGVVDQYEMHDRIHDGGTEKGALEEAGRQYVGERLRGKSAVVVVTSNAQASVVNSAIREELVKLGLVDREGLLLERDGNVAGVGDIIKPRKTDWTPGGEMRNQGRYVVRDIHEDGGMTVSEQGHPEVTKRISARFVKDWVELGYAGTAHSTQGATVDRAVTVAQEGMSAESLYVGMSRGRERNTAIVVTAKEGMHPATEDGVDRGTIDAVGVITAIVESEVEDGKAALTQLRADVEHQSSMGVISDLTEEATREHCRTRTSKWLDEAAVDGRLSIEDRARVAAENGAEQLGRRLRVVEQAGHDPKVVLDEALAEAPVDDAKSVSQVLHYRISQKYKADIGLDAERSTLPPADAPADYQEHFERLEDMASERRSELGAQQAAEPQAWATETLGPVPDDSFARVEWEERAGIIAAHREASGWTDEQEPLGHAPGTAQTELRARWAQAWAAAGRPEAVAAEHELSEGALRNRVAAMQREDAAMPDSVFEEMQALEARIYEAEQAAAREHREADLCVDEFEAAQRREKAAEHQDYVERYQMKRAQLQQVDDLRVELMENQAVTRDLGTRAWRELEEARGVVVGQEKDRCTAQEWLAREAEVRVEDDAHRPIAELDLAENTMMVNDRALVDEGIIAADDQAQHDSVPSDMDVEIKLMKARAAAARAADRASMDADRLSREALWSRSSTATPQERTVVMEDDLV